MESIPGLEAHESRSAYQQHLAAAREHKRVGRLDAAWACLEAAHIVGQRSTLLHVRSHFRMLGLSWRMHDWRELSGQVSRTIAALVITWLWVPVGNTGRARVSPIRPEPVPRDLAELVSTRDAG